MEDISKTVSLAESRREDDQAIKEILWILKRLLESVRRDLDTFSLETAISLLRHGLKSQTRSVETRSVLQHHLRRALLMRYGFFGWIRDLEACNRQEKDTYPFVVEGTTGRDTERIEEVQCAIELMDNCRQVIDTNALDDIIWVAEESTVLYTECGRARKAELLILLGNALVIRCLKSFRDPELTYAASKFREAEILCGGNPSLSYICFTALTHIGWLRATECGCWEGMKEMTEYTGKGMEMDKEGKMLFEIGTDMAEKSVESSQVDEAIALLYSSLRCRMPPHPQRSLTLRSLANALWIRFRQRGDPKDLENSIHINRRGLGLVSINHPDRSAWLNNLAGALNGRFDQKGNFEDLEECIQMHREALEARPSPHPERSASLINLAAALLTRFQHLGTLQDFERSVILLRQALDMVPAPHPNRFGTLNNLANALFTRFTRQEVLRDLEDCIVLYREALDLTPPLHPHRLTSLENLANALSTQFERTGALQSLEESIPLLREALNLQPPLHPNRSGALGNLANALCRRFRQKGMFSDLEDSILLHREALELRSSSHTHLPTLLSNLGGALLTRFQQRGVFQDLEECILLHREAIDLSPPPHPNRHIFLNDLAHALSTRFHQMGASQDLEECISMHREALYLLQAPDINRPQALTNLANVLYDRFKQKGAFQDLEDSILMNREALEGLPSHRPLRSDVLNNLANTLSTRFRQKRTLHDLEECIVLHREALDLQPAPHPRRPTSLSNLGNALFSRFDEMGTLQDLDESILLHREALCLHLPSHPQRFMSLNNLAGALSTRFMQRKTFEDLEECILLHQETLELQPPPHPGRPASFHNLAIAYSTLYDHKQEETNLMQAFYYFDLASRYETGPMLNRLTSIQHSAALARRYRPAASLDSYRYALELLPQLASLDLTLKERWGVLEHSRELAGDAAQSAISQDQFETAVTFLSTARSIFWSQALQLRTPVDELAAINPTLARNYLNISEQLEQASHASAKPGLGRQVPHEATFRSLSTLANRRNQIIEEIRGIPGFEGFLLAPSFQSLALAAHSGPIVLLNASAFGCDALVMREAGSVTHVALPTINIVHLEVLKLLIHKALVAGLRSIDYNQPDVQTAIDILQTLLLRDFGRKESSNEDIIQSVLEVLWNTVVRPVIEALEIVKTDSPRRIWWCPSGAFASLPIHAAGIYNDENEPVDCLFQYVVSSYCTSPQDLLHPTPQISRDFTLTAIIEPEAPGGIPLPAAADELLNIEKHIPNQSQLITHFGLKVAPNQVEDVMPDIRRSSFVHFGCHGSQNLRDPLESSLLLSGGKLTMSRIIKECQASNSAALAYLSACETAKGDKDRPDESLNLVATMMFAGFRSVVGTMWSIFDADAPIVANVFYGHLFRKGRDATPDVRDAAYGLHLATKELRERGRSFYSWVPYVHYGI